MRRRNMWALFTEPETGAYLAVDIASISYSRYTALRCDALNGQVSRLYLSPDYLERLCAGATVTQALAHAPALVRAVVDR